MTKEIKIYLDAGHGGTDPGAVGNGLKEKDITLDLVSRIAKKLTNRNEGFQLKLSRTTDVTKSLKQRTDEANAWGADFYLSIHVNAGGGTGYEDFVHNSLGSNSKTARLRNVIHERITALLPTLSNRGRKYANFHVLRESKMPAMLTESLFIDNKSDAELLKDSSFIDTLAEGHVGGLVTAFNLPPKRKPVETKPTPDKTVSKGNSSKTEPVKALKPNLNTISIVTYMNSIGADSSYANRARLAREHGIMNYRGSAPQNIKLLEILRSLPESKVKGDMNTVSIVDYLNSIGLNSSFTNRSALAKKYGIKGYTGTAKQNTELLQKLRN